MKLYDRHPGVPHDLPEIRPLRAMHSKTFDLGRGKRKLVQFVGPIHWRDGERWEDIDLEPRHQDDGMLRVDQAPYKLIVDPTTTILRHESRLTGLRARAGIIAIGGKAVTLPAPVVEDGRIRWLQVVDGVDLELRLTPTGAQWLRHIHHADAPHSFTWTVQRQEAFDGDRIVEQGAGEDAGREKAGVTLRRSEARAINGWVKWETEETFDRRVSRILDRKTRRRGWSDEVQYPVVLHG